MKSIEEHSAKIWGGKHAANSIFHTLGGIGIGFLLVNYLAIGDHIWGWILVGISVAGHLWAWMSK